MKSKIRVKRINGTDCFNFELDIALQGEGSILKQFVLNHEETMKLKQKIDEVL